MSLIGASLGTLAGSAVLAAGCGALAPVQRRAALVGSLTGVCGAAGSVAGVAALTGQGFTLTVTHVLPLSALVLSVDALSGIFMLLIGFVAVAVAVYSVGYTSPGDTHGSTAGASSRTSQIVLPLFVAALLLVPAAASVTTFLALWELMALTSLVLVLAEHHGQPAAREAGIWYAALTHAGMVAILIGLVVFANGAGGESFAAMRDGAGHLSPVMRSMVFVLVFVGFASKAGAVPLHVWLPRAHAESPSHVSALMSGGMVHLGIYGLIRVSFDLLGGGPRWWGLLVLLIGALSALHGVLQATVATDLKRLLAYSTIENVGLMLMGVGAAGMFAAAGNRTLATLLIAAALLHAVNHAAFKTLLFMGAGSVLRATGLRDLDSLGGLAARMPMTAALTAFGALGAAALPPGNGFVSEWLLLQGLTHSLSGPGAVGVMIAVTMPLAVGVVALTAGLGVAAMIKAFGVGFLARPRSASAAAATESPISMRAGMSVAAATCAALALAPTLVADPLERAVAVLRPVRNGAPFVDHGLTLRLAGIAGSMSPLLIAVGMALAMVVLLGLVKRMGRGLPRRVSEVWGGGGSRLSPRMEYTATSFAEPLTRVFDDVLRPEQDINITHFTESRYLIESVHFRQRVPDRIEARIYPPLVAATRLWGRWASRLQNGSVHRYLAYELLGMLTLLIVVGITA